jgi:hypothetical protein
MQHFNQNNFLDKKLQSMSASAKVQYVDGNTIKVRSFQMKTNLPTNVETDFTECFFDMYVDTHGSDVIGTLFVKRYENARRVKATIRRNSYDFQSWGEVLFMAPSTGEWVSIHKTRIDDLPIMRKHDNGQGTFVDSFRASERYSDEEWEAMQDAMVQSLYSLIEIEKLVLQ